MIDFKQFRTDRGITQLTPAEKLGIAQSQLSKYERGREPSEGITARIVDVYPEAEGYRLEPVAGIEALEAELRACHSMNAYLREKLDESLDIIRDFAGGAGQLSKG